LVQQVLFLVSHRGHEGDYHKPQPFWILSSVQVFRFPIVGRKTQRCHMGSDAHLFYSSIQNRQSKI
jgi:hypothetical protein